MRPKALSEEISGRAWAGWGARMATRADPFRHFKSSPEVIRLAMLICVCFPILLRNVKDLLFEPASMSAMKRWGRPADWLSDQPNQRVASLFGARIRARPACTTVAIKLPRGNAGQPNTQAFFAPKRTLAWVSAFDSSRTFGGARTGNVVQLP